jgi:hypothetical protein
MFNGSSAALIARMAASSAGVRDNASTFSFFVPMPCSADTEPPISPGHAVHHGLDLGRCVARPVGFLNDDMQIAVAEMSIDQDGRVGPVFAKLLFASVSGNAYVGDREADIEGNAAGNQPLILTGRVANGPERGGIRLR